MSSRTDRLHPEEGPLREVDGHRYSNIGVTVFDQGACSCGWRGKGYWDGADLAYDDWMKHIEAVAKQGTGDVGSTGKS